MWAVLGDRGLGHSIQRLQKLARSQVQYYQSWVAKYPGGSCEEPLHGACCVWVGFRLGSGWLKVEYRDEKGWVVVGWACMWNRLDGVNADLNRYRYRMEAQYS